jgi:uncharacterized XkdX family phage protein
MKSKTKEETAMNFESVKNNYDRGLWKKPMVKMAVRKGFITKEEYKEITGEDYE